MNQQPKSKVLVLIIGILLVANIAMLSFFIFTGNKQEKKERGGKKNHVSEYLEKEVGFDATQMALYDSLGRRQREKMRSTFNELAPGRKDILKKLAAASFNDSAISDAAGALHNQQKIFEVNMLKHLRDIREICTEAQRQRFDTGFYKILGKRRDSHKEK